MFAQEIIRIERTVEEVYEFLSSLSKQLNCWEMITAPPVMRIENGVERATGRFTLGQRTAECLVELYLTRPGAGCVTKIFWDNGEVAAEWRIIDDGGHVKVELNLEGAGGGLANSVHMRQMAHHVLQRLKHQFDKA